MIEKRSRSLSTKVNSNFYDMVKVCLIMINNVNIIYESLIENVMKTLPTIYQQETKASGKTSKFRV